MLFPRLRSDLLIIARERADGEQEFLIKDPVRRSYMTANSLQYFFFSKFDGKHSLQAICSEASEFFETELPAALGDKIFENARKANLLDIAHVEPSRFDSQLACRRAIRSLRRADLWSSAERLASDQRAIRSETDLFMANAVAQLTHRRLQECVKAIDTTLELEPSHSLALQIRRSLHDSVFAQSQTTTEWSRITVPLINPDRILTQLNRVVGWLFDPLPMLIVALLLMAVDIVLLLLLQDRPTPDLLAEHGWVVAPLFALSSIPHEFGHGLAANRAGARVQAMGLLILYAVMFGAYTDVSDIHVIEDAQSRVVETPRATKLAIYAAGIYVNLWIVLLCSTFALLAADGFATSLAAALAVMSVYIILFNLMPFAQLDGYLLLQEALGLGGTDLSSVANSLLSDLIRGSSSRLPATTTVELSPWARAILICYALGRAGWILFVLGVLGRFYYRLTGWLGAFGAILYVVVIYNQLLRFARMFASLSRMIYKNRRAILRPVRFAPLCLFGGGLVWSLCFAQWPTWIYAQGVVRSSARADVRSLWSGVVASVAIRDRERVSRGQEIARLDDAAERAHLSLLLAQREGLTSKLAELRSGARPEERSVARATLARMRMEARSMAQQANRAAFLADGGLVPQSDAERTKGTQLVDAQRARESAAVLRVVEAGARPEQIAALEAQIRSIDAATALVRIQLEQLVLRSPIDGVIATPFVDELRGRSLAPGDLFCTVVAPGRTYVEARIPKYEDVADVAPFDQARVWLDTGHTYVTRLLDAPKRADADSALIAHTEPFASVAADGSSAQIRIYGRSHSLVVKVLRPIVQFWLVDFWSLW